MYIHKHVSTLHVANDFSLGYVTFVHILRNMACRSVAAAMLWLWSRQSSMLVSSSN